MEKTKFTAGEWQQSDVTPHWIVTTREIGGDICKVSAHGGDNEMTETDLANAKLIAAAPELYEACEWAIGVVTDKTVYEKLKSALLKAGGEV